MTLALEQPPAPPQEEIAPPIAPVEADFERPVPRRYRTLIKKIRTLEAHLAAFSDKQFRQYIGRIRAVLREGAAIDKQIPAVFAAVSVVARRHLNMRPYNSQLIGGYELHRGRVAEMPTGEGKTLVATLPTTLNAITGKGVHVVTVNDYLAKRDAELMTPVYKALGLTVGVIVSGMEDAQRRAAYRCDVVYGTNKEFGFDYLRDQIKLHEASTQQKVDTLALLNRRESTQPVQRQLHYAVIDEADSILIDESRTPLIIAGASGTSPLAWAYAWANTLAARFHARHDFEYEPQRQRLDWKDAGLKRLQKILAETSTPSIAGGSGESWQNLVLNALRAKHLFLKERNYVVTAGEGPGAHDEVVIVDEYTGRRMPGRTWSEGIHQAVQAKENLTVTTPS
ncbi:MAG TPA: DEAD/DEAH box helicase, partial [Phycisphaerae bacterium]|nr:DEAD/DEAH box helicase [Phycisphaerae bacterium]